ncbi:Xylose regulator from LacI family [Candidatus Rhodobacter oscarellae]|uniref:Xylose regulator from LacI family n=2 Tax=Candidatus Rhodobacter oscarellae TaxID=1675527 RepID=A0A0J9EAY1_9RHOB|nr:Xylose regulator from LacI family [Candidatus Rhodobacter lobularis]
MSKRVGIRELAKHAGVSTATVDRVLHGRGSYSAKSEIRVKEAIEALGYGSLEPHLTEPKRKLMRFVMFVPALENFFQQSIIKNARIAAQGLRHVHVEIEFGYIDLIGGLGTLRALRGIDPSEVDGVCLFAVDAPGVRDEIDRLVEQGVAVCTIVSDVPSSTRSAFIGLDNVAAGRTAGRFVSRLARPGPGEVGIVTGCNQIRDHIERMMGFNQSLTMYRPDLRMLPPQEGFSKDASNATIVRQLIRRHPDLAAIYSIAGGSCGVIDGLRYQEKPEGLFVVVHELEPMVREALIDGAVDMVLHQDTRSMTRLAMNALVAACEGREPDPETLAINIYVAENLP